MTSFWNWIFAHPYLTFILVGFLIDAIKSIICSFLKVFYETPIILPSPERREEASQPDEEEWEWPERRERDTQTDEGGEGTLLLPSKGDPLRDNDDRTSEVPNRFDRIR